MQTLAAMLITSPGLLEMVTPFSLGMLLELLLGELGPEPGALLHADSRRTHTAHKLDFSNMLAWANQLSEKKYDPLLLDLFLLQPFWNVFIQQYWFKFIFIFFHKTSITQRMMMVFNLIYMTPFENTLLCKKQDILIFFYVSLKNQIVHIFAMIPNYKQMNPVTRVLTSHV